MSYRTLDVPVAGGTIAAGRWGTGDRVVVASHGITANHLSWQRVGQLVVERSDDTISMVAVDHRGRAGSAETPGPYGMRAHGADLIAVLDHHGLDSAVLAGHSMGGFVTTAAAEADQDRVDGIVLVDGGLPFPLDLPDDVDVDVETVVQSVIGPALDRLDQRWPDVEAYVDFFRAHPAFQPPNRWYEAVEAYVSYDAVKDADGLVRSSVQKDAVLVDGGAAIVDPESSSAIDRIACPIELLWAPRGILDQSPGLYTEAAVTGAVDRLPNLRAELIEDTNHYTVLVGDAGATAVADAIIRAVDS